LFLSEHRPEILGINLGVATIPLFGVNVPSSSESVRLGTEFSGSEMNDKVKLEEKFRPPGLPAGEDFGGREILQVFVVSDDINRGGRALKVMVPVPECLKDGKEFLIMGVIVQLWSSQGPGVECYWTDFSIGAGDRQDTSDGIVGGIRFHNDRGIWNKVSKDGCSGEGMLESIESVLTVLGEDPRSIFPGEPGERDHNVRVIENEPAVEIGESKEGLDVLYLTRFRPIGDGLDFVRRHSQTFRGQTVAKVFH